MDNLKLESNQQMVSSDLLLAVKCMTIDTDLDVLYLVNADNEVISIDVNNSSLTKCCDICLDVASYEAICCEFMSEERSVFIALTTGHIVVFNTMTNTYGTVGCLSDGIQSVAFSLDQELIVLVTQNNSLVLMNKLFDVLTQKDLNTDEFGCHELVSVNWGSKATQFHGEGQRDSRTQQQTFKSYSDFDDKVSQISWRSDGLYFVTSFFDHKTNYRKLQVWSRDAVLQYTSECLDGLEALIAWKPSGALIASSQLLPNKHMIVFVEKNGLKHGEFELPFTPNSFKVQHILWSNDSQILLIIGSETREQLSPQIMMLWRQTNYKWDLKQRYEFKDNTIVAVNWDSIDASLLHVILNNGQYIRYRWKWSTDDLKGMVALIDKNHLKLSDFECSVIPPPFYSYSLDFKSQILETCFSKNKLAVVLIDGTIALFEKSAKKETNGWNDFFAITLEKITKESEEVFNCFYANKCEDITKLTHLTVDETGLLYGIQSKQLFCFDFRNEIQNIVKVLDIITDTDDHIIAISCLKDTIGVIGSSGHLLKANLKDKVVDYWTDRCDKKVVFPNRCSRLELIQIENRIVSICLSEDHTLYLDNEVLSQNNCNSFVNFNDKFLVFTTTDHLLHCWPINGNIFEANVNYGNLKARSVERGSKIVCATSDAKIVLQMPRGNLETIHPRPLLLDIIMSKLNAFEYDLAFDLLRKHRINLNFICDYKPNTFNDNIETFVKQIGAKNIEWINLFLTDLSNEDFYDKLCNPNAHKINKFSAERIKESIKSDLICDSMREVMDRLDANKYLHPILLTYVKKHVSEIDKALQRIKVIEDTVIRDKAIKFLLYIININTLLDEAMGTYDSQLFLMIASKSQKDPKEYLALLDQLNQIECFEYKCFKIDMHLKRYKKALTHISKLDDHFEECLGVIREHSLYRDAVVLFDTECDDKKDRVWKLYAEYLFNKRYFEESAIAYKRGHDFVNAVKAYQLSGNWSAAIDCVYHCSHVINAKTVAQNLAKHLATIGKHFEASYLLEVYAEDINESIRTLIDGHEWEHTSRLLTRSPNEELLAYLKTELQRHYELALDMITKNYDILIKHMNRLEIVYQKKSQKSQEFQKYDNFDDKSEIYSETSGLSDSHRSSQKSTSSSLATRKSRKSVKKSEMKKYVLKEGSADEDIQLIYAINELIKTIDRTQEEVSLLIKTLYNYYYSDEALKIQHEFHILLNLINNIIKEIWTQNELQDQSEEWTQKYKITDSQLMRAPELRKIDWKLALI